MQLATAPAVSDRLQGVDELLDLLSAAEAAAVHASEVTIDPLDAGPGDLLEGGWKVVRALGRGSSATALLVKRVTDGDEKVKVALNADLDERITHEYEALSRGERRLPSGTGPAARRLQHQHGCSRHE